MSEVSVTVSEKKRMIVLEHTKDGLLHKQMFYVNSAEKGLIRTYTSRCPTYASANVQP